MVEEKRGEYGVNIHHGDVITTGSWVSAYDCRNKQWYAWGKSAMRHHFFQTEQEARDYALQIAITLRLLG